MNQIAFILEGATIYWHAIILALAVLAGICFFMACCLSLGIRSSQAAATVLLSVILSALLARFLYWYSRPDGFSGLMQAMTTPVSGNYALTGVFFGCTLAAVLTSRNAHNLPQLLDCMSIAGCGALALGRLSHFFTTSDRGQIVTEMTFLPWSYPVPNPASGMPDYRLATFMFQAIIAFVLFLVLAGLFFSRRKKFAIPQGDYTLLFLMVYSASQVLLDSTRYDSLYFRSNGFVSIVQVLCAVVLGVSIIRICIRAVKALGFRKWMALCWGLMAALFGLAGYMEYYVQRHGRLAFFSYSIMEHCLVGILVISLTIWQLSLKDRAAEIPEPISPEPMQEKPAGKFPAVKLPPVKIPALKMPELKIPAAKLPEPKKPAFAKTESAKAPNPEPQAADLQELDLDGLDLPDIDLDNLDLSAYGIVEDDLLNADTY